MRARVELTNSSSEPIRIGSGSTIEAMPAIQQPRMTVISSRLVGPRIAYAMALDGLFFGGVDRVHAAYRTPAVAIGVQAGVVVVLLLLLRSFPSALDFTVFAIVLATMADVLALYRLRARQPARPRPYRALGYPWLPGLYLVANGAIAGAMLVGTPFEALLGLGMLASGLPFYALFVRRRRLAP